MAGLTPERVAEAKSEAEARDPALANLAEQAATIANAYRIRFASFVGETGRRGAGLACWR
jgi:hypothetical protein